MWAMSRATIVLLEGLLELSCGLESIQLALVGLGYRWGHLCHSLVSNGKAFFVDGCLANGSSRFAVLIYGIGASHHEGNEEDKSGDF